MTRVMTGEGLKQTVPFPVHKKDNDGKFKEEDC